MPSMWRPTLGSRNLAQGRGNEDDTGQVVPYALVTPITRSCAIYPRANPWNMPPSVEDFRGDVRFSRSAQCGMIHRHGFCARRRRFRSASASSNRWEQGFRRRRLLLQHVSGTGTAWIELSSELIMKDLQPGETLPVHPGHVGAFEACVSFQITTCRESRT
jgi:hypothetical protein